MVTATKGRAKAPAAAAPDSAPKRFIDGLAVIGEEAVASPLSTKGKKIVFHGLRLLTLEGGKQVFGCAECEEHGTRGEIVKHRGLKHGAKLARPQRGRPPAQPSWPVEVTSLSLAELLEIARDAPHWERMFEEQKNKLDEVTNRALVAEQRVRQIGVALDRVGFALKVEED